MRKPLIIIWSLSSVAAVIIVFMTLSIISNSSARRYEKGFSDITQLSFKSIDNVRIEPGGINKIMIKYPEGTHIKPDKNCLEIHGRYHRNSSKWDKNHIVLIRVPRQLELSKINGSTQGALLLYHLHVHRVDLSGHGEIIIKRTQIKKALKLHNDGDVVVDHVNVRTIDQKNKEGDIVIRNSNITGKYVRLRSNDGTIVVNNNRFRSLSAKTKHGENEINNNSRFTIRAHSKGTP